MHLEKSVLSYFLCFVLVSQDTKSRIVNAILVSANQRLELNRVSRLSKFFNDGLVGKVHCLSPSQTLGSAIIEYVISSQGVQFVSPLLTTVNLRRAFALFLCSIGFLSIGAEAADSPAAKTTDTAAVSKAVKAKEDLPNFHQVHPFLYRGGEPTKEGLKKIKEMGITTIFDLRNPGEMAFNEKEAAKELGMRYISMPMNSKAPTEKQIKRMIDEIDKAKDNAVQITEPGQTEKIAAQEAAEVARTSQKSEGAPAAAKKAVFVHCAHGSDRTGCMIGIWRVKRDGYDYDTAYKEMRKYWFTPKFTNLSGAVRQAAAQKAQ